MNPNVLKTDPEFQSKITPLTLEELRGGRTTRPSGRWPGEPREVAMGKNKTKKRTRRPNKGWLAGSSATQTICGSFLLVIAVGTLLLTLPISSRTGRLGVIDAMFTATSATCVTGLVVRDTWSQFSLFGQVIILMLIQVGGLGLVTLTSFFALAARRRMGFRDLRLLTFLLYRLKISGCSFFKRWESTRLLSEDTQDTL